VKPYSLMPIIMFLVACSASPPPQIEMVNKATDTVPVGKDCHLLGSIGIDGTDFLGSLEGTKLHAVWYTLDGTPHHGPMTETIGADKKFGTQFKLAVNPPKAGEYTYKVWVEDANGQKSNSVQDQFTASTDMEITTCRDASGWPQRWSHIK